MSPVRLGGQLQEFRLGGTVYPALHMAGPELISRPGSEAHHQHWKNHLPSARQVVTKQAADLLPSE